MRWAVLEEARAHRTATATWTKRDVAIEAGTSKRSNLAASQQPQSALSEGFLFSDSRAEANAAVQNETTPAAAAGNTPAADRPSPSFTDSGEPRSSSPPACDTHERQDQSLEPVNTEAEELTRSERQSDGLRFRIESALHLRRAPLWTQSRPFARAKQGEPESAPAIQVAASAEREPRAGPRWQVTTPPAAARPGPEADTFLVHWQHESVIPEDCGNAIDVKVSKAD